MAALFNRSKQWLASRSPQERRMLLIGLLVIVGALIVHLGKWTWQEQRRLNHRLPEARQLLAQMQQNATELQQLKRQPAPASIATPILTQSVHTAASASGLVVTINPGFETIEVEGQGPFAPFIDWLANIQAQYSLRVTRLNLTDENGNVHFSLSLLPPPNL